jgi:hypothetical protein
MLWPQEEFNTMELLIGRIREKALDEYYEQDMKDSGIEIVGTYVIFIDSYLYYSSEIYCYVHIIA